MQSISIIFVAPAKAVKATITAKYLFSQKIVDLENSLILVDAEPSECNWIPRNVSSAKVVDKTLHKSTKELCGRKYDFLISCGWGTKIATEALSIPKIAALNCHSSYLPDYKGGSVYNYYWANCEKHAGATVHFTTDKFDQGNILAQQKFSILSSDTPHSILVRASEMTGPLLVQAMLLASMGFSGEPQSGGRYFMKTRHWRLRAHRLFNRGAVFLGLPRWLTPHKEK